MYIVSVSVQVCVCVSWLMLIVSGHSEVLTVPRLLNDGDDVNKHREAVTTPLFTIWGC